MSGAANTSPAMEIDMSEGLKPCGHCGGEASLEKRRGYVFATGGAWHRERAYCRNNKCGMTTATFKKPGLARKAWNRRTPDPAVLAVVEAMSSCVAFVEALEDNDPDEPIADNGMTVLCKLQFDAPALSQRARAALAQFKGQG